MVEPGVLNVLLLVNPAPFMNVHPTQRKWKKERKVGHILLLLVRRCSCQVRMGMSWMLQTMERRESRTRKPVSDASVAQKGRS